RSLLLRARRRHRRSVSGRNSREGSAGWSRGQRTKTMTRRTVSARRLAWQLTTIVLGSGLTWAGVMAQAPQELIIRNGLVVNVDGRRQADVRVRNGAIAEIVLNLAATA